MGESILYTVKHHLGIQESYTQFDVDIIDDINSTFSILRQLGVGPEAGFYIEDATATWDDFISGDPANLRLVRSYVFAKVKLMFDPPTQSGALLESLRQTINEFEWRLNVEVDPKEKNK